MTAVGPGTNDMKSGDVVIVLALQALRAADLLQDADITIALIGDEESPGEPLETVRRDLVEAAQRVDVALGFEGGVRDSTGEYATVARRGASEWKLEVTGQEGHSSGIFTKEAGAGAIFEAARILTAFYDEVRGEEYLTFNAGAILGGTDVTYDFEETRGTVFGKTNVIPKRAVVHGGIRTISLDQLERARRQMRQIVSRHLPVTSAQITFTDGYPPMAPTDANRALMDLYNQGSVDLGLGTLRPLDPGRRGAADISFAAPYADALAGLGAIGQGAHAPGESVDLGSIRTAAKRAAILIHRLTSEKPTM
jgi:glutamate carboxypeptidase